MGYTTLIERNLDLAFKVMGDLVSNMTLLRKSNPTFNFSTVTATTASIGSEPVKGIFTSTVKNSSDRNVVSKVLYINTEAIEDVSVFESVQHGSDVWRIGPGIKKFGTVYRLPVSKEK